jgi:RimJ/RimL family protein N-acetyltransferase
MCADREVMRYLLSGAVMDREAAAAHMDRFARHWEQRGFGQWAVEEKGSGEFIGRIGLMLHDDWPGPDKVEVGWVLDRSRWGRGYATEGALASLRFGFEELGLGRIISIVFPANTASRRVMEKVDLSYRGEERWRGKDLVWYAADREEWMGA